MYTSICVYYSMRKKFRLVSRVHLNIFAKVEGMKKYKLISKQSWECKVQHCEYSQ